MAIPSTVTLFEVIKLDSATSDWLIKTIVGPGRGSLIPLSPSELSLSSLLQPDKMVRRIIKNGNNEVRFDCVIDK
jgi:hypothetical protein